MGYAKETEEDKVEDKGELDFTEKVRLEVSGIMNGPLSKIIWRAKERLRQTHKSDSTGFPAYVVVVEFSRPIANYIKNELCK